MILQSNSPNISHWNRDTGYSNKNYSSAYPRRMFNADLIGGLRVLMRLVKPDMDFICNDPTHGFDVILTSPGEVIKRWRHTTFRIPPGEEDIVTIRPTYYSTSMEIQHFVPEKRQCFYSYEHRLRFFKFYAKLSCEVECLANYTLMKCGCVKFTMPSMYKIKIPFKIQSFSIFHDFI